MAELFDMKKAEERLILVGVALQTDDDTKESLEELAELVATAGGTAVAMVIQNRESVHPGTYIGKGKIDEIRDLMWETDATGVVCDDELSPAQIKNLEAELQVKLMDRTMVILDIFAKRASTKEGKIQVELAQLQYRSSRLIGLRSSLSRLGGGIGTKGPGEKKLEMDRRLIKSRIVQLNKELSDVKQSRETTRQQRSKSTIPVVAIVGYTNAGKSTLLNRLTGASVLEEDQLFATLDPTTRGVKLESGQEVLLTDTVGFIRKLPHHLINAFRSTLEEAKYADIILHVVDSSNPEAYTQMHIVYDTLKNLNVQDKTIVTAFNKQDKLPTDQIIKDLKSDYSVKISAKEGEGLEELLCVLEQILKDGRVFLEHLFPYTLASQIQQIRKYGQMQMEEYREDGIYVEAYVPKDIWAKLDLANQNQEGQ